MNLVEYIQALKLKGSDQWTPEEHALVEGIAKAGPPPPEVERILCADEPGYFVSNYCKILSNVGSQDGVQEWKPFKLWPAQAQDLERVKGARKVIILKARQLGFTWWILAGRVLHKALFHPVATILLFSKTDREASEMVERLKGMYERLPKWMTVPITENAHEINFANGSSIMAFPTTAGQSYTATMAVIDEADWLSVDLSKVLSAVKPTVDAGGQLIILSTPDKSKPTSLFKSIYRAAVAGENGYLPIFRGWNERPDRSREWYEAERKADLAQTGSLDHVYEVYPETAAQALAAREQDKRLAPQWLQQCFEDAERIPLPDDAPSIHKLVIYKTPEVGHQYVIGADPAEGNPHSDDSALIVMDEDNGEEVAKLAGKYEMTVFAGHIDEIGRWYNMAKVLVERNNHGHAVLLALREMDTPLYLLCGPDEKDGWLDSPKGKVLLYNTGADTVRTRSTLIHSLDVYHQLASVEGATLKAPEGMPDDLAVAYVLACNAMVLSKKAAWLDDEVKVVPWSPMAAMPADLFSVKGRMF